MADEKQFRLWVFRPRGWVKGDAGRLGATLPFSEPAEAADAAEMVLQQRGVPGQSYCELRFNGDEMPHTVICYLEDSTFGIWNTDAVKWPIFYAPEGHNSMLGEFPFNPAEDGSAWNREDEGKSEKSDEGDMKLDEIKDSGEDEDDSDEGTEDDEIQEDDDPQDSDSGDSGDEDDEDEETEDDSDEGEDDQGETGESDSEDGDGEDEKERPRLKIFAKFRTPKGWRKRAETEELQERNTFAFKIGILDEDAEKTGQQEREVFAEVQFIEDDADRVAGTLRMKLPAGIEFSEPTKSGWITARIPYRQED